MITLVEYIGVSVARPILGRSGVHMISSAVNETRPLPRRARSAASPAAWVKLGSLRLSSRRRPSGGSLAV